MISLRSLTWIAIRGGLLPHLGRVVEPQAAAAARGRRRFGDDVGDEAVELRGRDALAGAVGQLAALSAAAPATLRPAGRRAGDHRRPQPQLARDPGPGVVDVGLGHVPLVQHEQGRAAGFHRHLGDPQVLGGDPLGGVADDDRHVGALDRPFGAQLGVVVDGPGDLGAAAQAGGVDQDHPAAVDLELGVDRVAGGAGDVGDDHPVGAEEGVDERGLADVGAADHGDPDRVVVFRRAADGRRARRRSRRAGRRCRARGVAETASGSPSPSAWNSAVTLKSLGRSALLTATSTGTRRRAGSWPARRRRRAGRRGRRPPAAIASASAIARRAWRLDVAGQLGLVLEVDAAGVDQVEGDPVPLAGEPLAVAGDAGLGRGDRLAAADQAVDQGALADVGEADDGDGGQAGAHARPRSRARPTTRPTTSSRPRPGGVELDRVVGGAQGAVLALGVAGVAAALGVEDRLDVLAGLGRAAAARAPRRRR